jgi:hypothetical protein
MTPMLLTVVESSIENHPGSIAYVVRQSLDSVHVAMTNKLIDLNEIIVVFLQILSCVLTMNSSV